MTIILCNIEKSLILKTWKNYVEIVQSFLNNIDITINKAKIFKKMQIEMYSSKLHLSIANAIH